MVLPQGIYQDSFLVLAEGFLIYLKQPWNVLGAFRTDSDHGSLSDSKASSFVIIAAAVSG